MKVCHRVQLKGDSAASSLIETLRKELLGGAATFDFDLRTTIGQFASSSTMKVSWKNGLCAKRPLKVKYACELMLVFRKTPKGGRCGTIFLIQRCALG